MGWWRKIGRTSWRSIHHIHVERNRSRRLIGLTAKERKARPLVCGDCLVDWERENASSFHTFTSNLECMYTRWRRACEYRRERRRCWRTRYSNSSFYLEGMRCCLLAKRRKDFRRREKKETLHTQVIQQSLERREEEERKPGKEERKENWKKREKRTADDKALRRRRRQREKMKVLKKKAR